MTATSAVEKTKGTERGCHKAQANTRKNQGASYQILDIAPGYSPLPRLFEPLLLACLPSSCLSDSSSFFLSFRGFFRR